MPNECFRFNLLCSMMLLSDLLFFHFSLHLQTTLILIQTLLTSTTDRPHPLLFLISLPVKSKESLLQLLIKHSPIIICLIK